MKIEGMTIKGLLAEKQATNNLDMYRCGGYSDYHVMIYLDMTDGTLHDTGWETNSTWTELGDKNCAIVCDTGRKLSMKELKECVARTIRGRRNGGQNNEDYR